ncbi:MAG: sulfotransferase family protein [Actinomycetota bacterium]
MAKSFLTVQNRLSQHELYRRVVYPRWRLALERRRQARVRRDPPTCPPGWTTGTPDFVGIGAQRCGTTWLYSLLERHPQVTSRYPKELMYFLTRSPPYESAHYQRYFPRAPGQIVGEWTPPYMLYEHTIAALSKVAPGARLLVSLRDPVDRYRSAVSYFAGKAGSASTEVIQQQERSGLYAAQLEHVLQHFHRDQVLVLQYERCRSSPLGELRKIFAFLGIDPSFVPRGIGDPQNVLTRRSRPLDGDTMERLRALYRPEVERLRDMVPHLDLGLWPLLYEG